MARILVLRQAEAAARTAAEIRRLGHEAVVLPVEAVRSVGFDPPTEVFAGLVVTSANAVPAALRILAGRDFPVLAVGPATATLLKQGGVKDVRAGAGEAESLWPEALRITQGKTPILYVAGRVRTGALEAAFERSGVPYRLLIVYEMTALTPSARQVEEALGRTPPDAVLLLSLGQVEGLLRLREAMPSRFDPPPRPICLSPRIAAALPPDLPAALVGQTPDLPSLLARSLAAGRSALEGDRSW